MFVPMIITGINVLLTLALVVAYARGLQRLRSIFTIGLFMFALLFLAQNALAFYSYVTMMPMFKGALAQFALGLSVLQLCAFAVLNYITWR